MKKSSFHYIWSFAGGP